MMHIVWLSQSESSARACCVARLHILRATTRQASNGAEAIDEYQLHHPDLVLMDLRMPVIGDAPRRMP